MENKYFQDQIKFQNEKFGRLTRNFTMEDWRECRNENYWQSDKITNPLDKIKFKNLCVEEYLETKNLLEK
jgi:hypothetical protein